MLTGGKKPWEERGVKEQFPMMFMIGVEGNVPETPEHASDLAKDFLAKCLTR